MSRLRRLSIRARLTAAFALALLLVVACAGVFVYARVEASLTESADEALSSRIDGLQDLVAGAGPTLEDAPPADPEDSFSQVLGEDGELLASTLPLTSGPALDPEQAVRAAAETVLIDGVELAGVDGDARALAGPAEHDGERLVVVAGSSNQDREETLAEVAAAFLVGAPLALLLASGIGYALSRRAMAPVAAMRRRADAIGGGRGSGRLPLPEADDEIRALGITLNSMLERLEAALERERAFVADASHELRTPLAILKAELELAEHGGRDPAELRAAINSALGEVDRMTRLADDLLVAARADRGEIPLRRELVDVRELLERVANRFRPRLDAGRDLRVEAPEDLRAPLDRLRVEQIMGNLIDNASRHGDGEITVRAGESASGDAARAVWIEVADEGPGFEPGFEAIAFDRFSRPDSGRTGEGAGLGLAIVRALAVAHGGSAEIVPGDGGRVRVTLPTRQLSSASHP